MAATVASVRPPRLVRPRLARERRQSELAVAYWEQKAAELGSRPTLTQLDPNAAIDNESWAHRFVIAPDPLAEVSTFLMCGASAARLLELGESPLKYTVMFRKMPERFLEIFTRGCRDAIASGSPTRLAGAVEREDGGRELYRTVFIPISVNLVFGAFNNTMTNPRTGSLSQAGNRFVGNLLPVIRELEMAGACSLGEIASALNARGLRTLRGRSWTRATVRNLLLRTSK
jgi:hypothetical protein